MPGIQRSASSPDLSRTTMRAADPARASDELDLERAGAHPPPIALEPLQPPTGHGPALPLGPAALPAQHQPAGPGLSQLERMDKVMYLASGMSTIKEVATLATSSSHLRSELNPPLDRHLFRQISSRLDRVLEETSRRLSPGSLDSGDAPTLEALTLDLLRMGRYREANDLQAAAAASPQFRGQNPSFSARRIHGEPTREAALDAVRLAERVGSKQALEEAVWSCLACAEPGLADELIQKFPFEANDKHREVLVAMVQHGKGQTNAAWHTLGQAAVDAGQGKDHEELASSFAMAHAYLGNAHGAIGWLSRAKTDMLVRVMDSPLTAPIAADPYWLALRAGIDRHRENLQVPPVEMLLDATLDPYRGNFDD